MKPFDTPEFKTIEPSQTAFLIPLDGDTKSNQANFDSMEFLESAKVATKRVRINHKWLQTGRGIPLIAPYKGRWVPSERLIIVERKPETREWTQMPNTGTSSKNEGIETESKDSIGFVVGIGITAQIDEADATLFLYRYNNKPLSQIMDQEIRNMVESKINEENSKLELKDAIPSKAIVLDNVRREVVKYFKERGITITNLGYKGQYTYSDPAIQAAINKVFKADKDKKAQETINLMNQERIKAEAEAKKIAQEETNQLIVAQAKAEKEAIEIRAKTMEMQIKLKQLEIQEAWIKKWDGKLPVYTMGEDANMMMMMDFGKQK